MTCTRGQLVMMLACPVVDTRVGVCAGKEAKGVRGGRLADQVAEALCSCCPLPAIGAGRPEPPPCVWACMRFGDYVEDEWWAVWLVVAMSRELQDLSIQVRPAGTVIAHLGRRPVLLAHPKGSSRPQGHSMCKGSAWS